jgi:integrase
MARKTRNPAGHTGQTEQGHTRDVKVERIGPVTIYKRGGAYYLYYREGGSTQRPRVDGNLAVARATASKVAAALADRRPSPIGHRRTSPEQMVAGYLDYIISVQKLALRTQDRYRAALERFLEFCKSARIVALDAVAESTVEDFVRWLRGQTRARNGAATGKRDVYKLGGVKFILSTCRTAFNWAARRRMLPPYAENPFARFPIEKLRDRDAGDDGSCVFTPAQEKAFFEACSDWQRGIFTTLAAYGLRVGELTHLLIEDVDLVAGSIAIRSKPELFWSVKSGRRRRVPLVPRIRELLEQLIGDRKAGIVFLNEKFLSGEVQPARSFASPRAFQAHLQKIVADLVAADPNATERAKRGAVKAFCRTMGQIPEKRVRGEFMKLTREIGCPEFTRAHDLRHLFSSRAQEAGMNPLMVQELLGHATLDMTRRYTHLGLDAMREALGRLDSQGDDAETRGDG